MTVVIPLLGSMQAGHSSHRTRSSFAILEDLDRCTFANNYLEMRQVNRTLPRKREKCEVANLKKLLLAHPSDIRQYFFV